jgi:hypothetical protein
MSTLCPLCKGVAIVAQRASHNTVTAIGGVAGAIQGVTSAIAASKSGGGATGSDRLGSIALVVVSGLLGGAAGCVTGAAMGDAIESAKPHEYLCQACGHQF